MKVVSYLWVNARMVHYTTRLGLGSALHPGVGAD